MEKLVNIQEFMELGLLQEANRKFFHPLGLCLKATINDDGTGHFDIITDDDPEGWYFPDDEGMSELRLAKANAVKQEWDKRAEARTKLLGSVIQPIPGLED